MPDKSKLDITKTVRTLKVYGKRNPWIGYCELQYKDVTKKIIIEKYLGGKEESLPEDYKIYCFNGKAKAILYVSERGGITLISRLRRIYYDISRSISFCTNTYFTQT